MVKTLVLHSAVNTKKLKTYSINIISHNLGGVSTSVQECCVWQYQVWQERWKYLIFGRFYIIYKSLGATIKIWDTPITTGRKGIILRAPVWQSWAPPLVTESRQKEERQLLKHRWPTLCTIPECCTVLEPLHHHWTAMKFSCTVTLCPKILTLNIYLVFSYLIFISLALGYNTFFDTRDWD